MFCYGIDQGAWTAINNANRLVQLPLGVLITAMLVPVLPRFTDQVANGKIEDMKFDFARALRLMWFLAMPLTALLLVLAEPAVRILFQRGEWTQRATDLTVAALVYQVPSIILYIGRDLITRVFYALQDSKTPYHVAIAAMIIKGLLDWYFVRVAHMGVAGISIATSLLTVINFALLATILRGKIGTLHWSQMIKPFAVMLAAATTCGAVALGSYSGLRMLAGDTGLFKAIAFTVISGSLGALAYLLVCIVLRLKEPQIMFERLFKKQGHAADSPH